MIPTILTVDPALGGGNTVMGLGLTPKTLYVLDCRIDYGLSKTEQQIEAITYMARKLKPHMCIIEFDAQQKGLGNDDRLRAIGDMLGFGIRPHITASQKRLDPVYNVASMAQSFVKSEISIPWGDDDSRHSMQELVDQLRKWNPVTPTKQLRQDAVMALWFGWRHWMKIREAQKPAVIAQSCPSWITDTPIGFMEKVAG